MTELEYKLERLAILEAFWGDMSDRVGLQEPVQWSLDQTSVDLGRLFMRWSKNWTGKVTG